MSAADKTMTTPLNVLIIDDSEDDTILIAHELKRAGYELVYERVDTPEATKAALVKKKWEVVICDHSMPLFSIPAALELIKGVDPDVPFIIVSGIIGEDTAVAAMKAGANDYVMKDKLARLAPAIERELREAEIRRLRRKAEQERAELLVAERKARQEAEVARREAEDASRVKDEFLASLSHELLTPLTAILGWVQLLKGGKLSPDEVKRAISIVERNGAAQRHLIDDLLDIASITTGKLRLRIESVDLASVVKQAIDTISLAASAKNNPFDMELAKGITVSGDSERLTQVVWNLLSNAVKFTPSGGRIHVRLESVGEQAMITVSDTGVGISADFLPHVFERFRQGDMSTTRKYQGLGIGLSLTRYLVELHGGTVSVASEGVDQGAVFVVSLPLKKLPVQHSSADGFSSHSTDAGDAEYLQLKGIKALIVEDDADTRELLIHMLAQHGAEILAVDSVSAAIESMEHSKPDILVADLSMPGEDGYALIKKIRQRNDTLKLIPAIAVTALIQAEDRKHALDAGYQFHVPKPIESSVLLKAIRSTIDSRNKYSR
jgi:signal transduction histidine kinase